MPEEFVSFENALRRLRVEPDELRLLVIHGTLQARRTARSFQFREEDIARLERTDGTRYISFEEAMNRLSLTSDQLKCLVSEGHVRAVRSERNTMRFVKEEIEWLAGLPRNELEKMCNRPPPELLLDDLLFDETDQR